MKAHFGLLLTVFLLQPAGMLAQEMPSVGQRIRIQQLDGPAVTGMLTSVTPDQVGIQVDGSDSEVGFDRSRITGLDRSLGEQRHFVKTLLVSVGVTAAAIGTFSAMAWQPCTDTGFMACFLAPRSRGEAFGMGAVGGAALGLPIGIVLGLAMKNEKWAPMNLDASRAMDVAVLPVLGSQPGVRASLSLRLF
jgi:hypothetical protein